MRAPRVLSICMIAFLCSCGTPEEKADQTYDTAADQLIAEFDGKVDKKAVDKVLELSKKITLDWRSKGITNYITTLKAQLKGMGKECKKLDDIEDFTIGQVLPGLEDWDLAPKDSTTTSVLPSRVGSSGTASIAGQPAHGRASAQPLAGT